MFIPALYFLNSVLMLLGLGQQFYSLFFLAQFLAIFYTPLASIYVYSILGVSFKKIYYVFIVSTLIGIIPVYLLFEFFKFSFQGKMDFFTGLVKGPYPLSVTSYSIVFYSFQQLVFVLMLLKVRRVKREFVDEISVQDHAKLGYIYKLVGILVVLNFFIVLLYLVFDILLVEYLLLPIIITIIYSFIVINAFKNNVVFTGSNYQLHLQQVQENPELREIIEEVSLVDPQLLEQINILLDNKNFLRQTDLTISEFSSQLGRPINLVSKTINLSFNQKFNDVINEKRIAYSQVLLKGQSNFTIEGVAYEVGFNSRATFYRAFKKHAGCTPSEFINN